MHPGIPFFWHRNAATFAVRVCTRPEEFQLGQLSRMELKARFFLTKQTCGQRRNAVFLSNRLPDAVRLAVCTGLGFENDCVFRQWMLSFAIQSRLLGMSPALEPHTTVVPDGALTMRPLVKPAVKVTTR
jgi:hypothetical protein